jgi:hypothetical protein
MNSLFPRVLTYMSIDDNSRCVVYVRRTSRVQVNSAAAVMQEFKLEAVPLVCLQTFYTSDGKKVKSYLCLTKHYAMKTGSGCIDPRFLDLGTNWG